METTTLKKVNKKPGYETKVKSPTRSILTKNTEKTRYNSVINLSVETELVKLYYVIVDKFTINKQTYIKALSPFKEVIYILLDIDNEYTEKIYTEIKPTITSSVIEYYHDGTKMHVYGLVFDTTDTLTFVTRDKELTGYMVKSYLVDKKLTATRSYPYPLVKMSEISGDNRQVLVNINKALSVITNKSIEMSEVNMDELSSTYLEFGQAMQRFETSKDQFLDNVKNNLPDLHNCVINLLKDEEDVRSKTYKSKEYQDSMQNLTRVNVDLINFSKACLDICDLTSIMKTYIQRVDDHILIMKKTV